MSGGLRDTEVKALAVSPAGRPSESIVVMTVTPEQKWPRTRRKSSGEITRLLYQFRANLSTSLRSWKTLQSCPSLTGESGGPYTSARRIDRRPRRQAMAETPRPGPPTANFIPEVKDTVAVSSGKGGVGKSTVAVHLALALKQKGHTVGLVDVDVYGPDVPIMMGAKGKPGMFDNKIIPVEAHGIKIMSIGLLVAEREALVWRGPMIHSAVQQFLRDVNWGPLDYLGFDIPPATGDAQLSLSQLVPLSGVVMVTTPQEVAGLKLPELR